MKPSLKPVLAGLLMVIAALLAFAGRPTERIADASAPVDLERMIPAQVDDWRIDPTIMPLVVSPDAQAMLNKLYNQTLARTYVNSAGQRVMLSIAYGGDQSDSLRLHAPEVCYAAQGFEVVRNRVGELATNYGVLPIKRLVATLGPRNEPITYWMTVGDRATLSGLRQKLVQIRYGMTGKIPDGILVRVSSIGADAAHSYDVQDRFIKGLLAEMKDSDRIRVIGKFGA